MAIRGSELLPSASAVGLLRRRAPSVSSVGELRRRAPSASSVGELRRPVPSAYADSRVPSPPRSTDAVLASVDRTGSGVGNLCWPWTSVPAAGSVRLVSCALRCCSAASSQHSAHRAASDLWIAPRYLAAASAILRLASAWASAALHSWSATASVRYHTCTTLPALCRSLSKACLEACATASRSACRRAASAVSCRAREARPAARRAFSQGS